MHPNLWNFSTSRNEEDSARFAVQTDNLSNLAQNPELRQKWARKGVSFITPTETHIRSAFDHVSSEMPTGVRMAYAQQPTPSQSSSTGGTLTFIRPPSKRMQHIIRRSTGASHMQETESGQFQVSGGLVHASSKPLIQSVSDGNGGIMVSGSLVNNDDYCLYDKNEATGQHQLRTPVACCNPSEPELSGACMNRTFVEMHEELKNQHGPNVKGSIETSDSDVQYHFTDVPHTDMFVQGSYKEPDTEDTLNEAMKSISLRQQSDVAEIIPQSTVTSIQEYRTQRNRLFWGAVLIGVVGFIIVAVVAFIWTRKGPESDVSDSVSSALSGVASNANSSNSVSESVLNAETVKTPNMKGGLIDDLQKQLADIMKE